MTWMGPSQSLTSILGCPSNEKKCWRGQPGVLLQHSWLTLLPSNSLLHLNCINLPCCPPGLYPGALFSSFKCLSRSNHLPCSQVVLSGTDFPQFLLITCKRWHTEDSLSQFFFVSFKTPSWGVQWVWAQTCTEHSALGPLVPSKQVVTLSKRLFLRWSGWEWATHLSGTAWGEFTGITAAVTCLPSKVLSSVFLTKDICSDMGHKQCSWVMAHGTD